MHFLSLACSLNSRTALDSVELSILLSDDRFVTQVNESPNYIKSGAPIQQNEGAWGRREITKSLGGAVFQIFLAGLGGKRLRLRTAMLAICTASMYSKMPCCMLCDLREPHGLRSPSTLSCALYLIFVGAILGRLGDE
ncbi:hypothetical protein CEXT_116461 [Caerostris extrusa]|uniref:Uncharacterized protein n=1 Tax=Caerostris extrusa TaxID=172846 RepID=A0AAV4VDN8_CAEEX|nr:hypothetical protein CEXT_116461 [Caerostris extrusa]